MVACETQPLSNPYGSPSGMPSTPRPMLQKIAQLLGVQPEHDDDWKKEQVRMLAQATQTMCSMSCVPAQSVTWERLEKEKRQRMREDRGDGEEDCEGIDEETEECVCEEDEVERYRKKAWVDNYDDCGCIVIEECCEDDEEWCEEEDEQRSEEEEEECEEDEVCYLDESFTCEEKSMDLCVPICGEIKDDFENLYKESFYFNREEMKKINDSYLKYQEECPNGNETQDVYYNWKDPCENEDKKMKQAIVSFCLNLDKVRCPCDQQTNSRDEGKDSSRKESGESRDCRSPGKKTIVLGEQIIEWPMSSTGKKKKESDIFFNNQPEEDDEQKETCDIYHCDKDFDQDFGGNCKSCGDKATCEENPDEGQIYVVISDRPLDISQGSLNSNCNNSYNEREDFYNNGNDGKEDGDDEDDDEDDDDDDEEEDECDDEEGEEDDEEDCEEDDVVENPRHIYGSGDQSPKRSSVSASPIIISAQQDAYESAKTSASPDVGNIVVEKNLQRGYPVPNMVFNATENLGDYVSSIANFLRRGENVPIQGVANGRRIREESNVDVAEVVRKDSDGTPCDGNGLADEKGRNCVQLAEVVSSSVDPNDTIDQENIELKGAVGGDVPEMKSPVKEISLEPKTPPIAYTEISPNLDRTNNMNAEKNFQSSKSPSLVLCKGPTTEENPSVPPNALPTPVLASLELSPCNAIQNGESEITTEPVLYERPLFTAPQYVDEECMVDRSVLQRTTIKECSASPRPTDSNQMLSTIKETLDKHVSASKNSYSTLKEDFSKANRPKQNSVFEKELAVQPKSRVTSPYTKDNHKQVNTNSPKFKTKQESSQSNKKSGLQITKSPQVRSQLKARSVKHSPQLNFRKSVPPSPLTVSSDPRKILKDISPMPSLHEVPSKSGGVSYKIQSIIDDPNIKFYAPIKELPSQTRTSLSKGLVGSSVDPDFLLNQEREKRDLKEKIHTLRSKKAEFTREIAEHNATADRFPERQSNVPRPWPMRFSAQAAKEEKPFHRNQRSPESPERPWPKRPNIKKANDFEASEIGISQNLSNDECPEDQKKGAGRRKAASYRIESGNSPTPHAVLADSVVMQKKKPPPPKWETRRPQPNFQPRPKVTKPPSMIYKEDIERLNPPPGVHNQHFKDVLPLSQMKLMKEAEDLKKGNSGEGTSVGWAHSLISRFSFSKTVKSTTESVHSYQERVPDKLDPENATGPMATQSMVESASGWRSLFKNVTKSSNSTPEMTSSEIAEIEPPVNELTPEKPPRSINSRTSKYPRALVGKAGQPTLLDWNGNNNGDQSQHLEADQEKEFEVFYFAQDLRPETFHQAYEYDLEDPRILNEKASGMLSATDEKTYEELNFGQDNFLNANTNADVQGRSKTKLRATESNQMKTNQPSNVSVNQPPEATQNCASVAQETLSRMVETDKQLRISLHQLQAWNVIQMVVLFIFFASLFCPCLMSRFLPWPPTERVELETISFTLERNSPYAGEPRAGLHWHRPRMGNSLLFEVLILPIRLVIALVNWIFLPLVSLAAIILPYILKIILFPLHVLAWTLTPLDQLSMFAEDDASEFPALTADSEWDSSRDRRYTQRGGRDRDGGKKYSASGRSAQARKARSRSQAEKRQTALAQRDVMASGDTKWFGLSAGMGFDGSDLQENPDLDTDQAEKFDSVVHTGWFYFYLGFDSFSFSDFWDRLTSALFSW